MKIQITLFIFLFIMRLGTAMAEDIEITVTNIQPERGGNIIVFIFAKTGFPKKHDKAIFIKTVKAVQIEHKFHFDLDLDEMAIKILHDENEDGKTSKNWTGIYPKEGLGFSNGQKLGTFGPPSYKKSKITRDEYLTGVKIAIRYP